VLTGTGAAGPGGSAVGAVVGEMVDPSQRPRGLRRATSAATRRTRICGRRSRDCALCLLGRLRSRLRSRLLGVLSPFVVVLCTHRQACSPPSPSETARVFVNVSVCPRFPLGSALADPVQHMRSYHICMHRLYVERLRVSAAACGSWRCDLAAEGALCLLCVHHYLNCPSPPSHVARPD